MDDNQTIDTLQLDIIINNKNATSRLNATSKAIDKLTASINAYNTSGGANGLVAITGNSSSATNIASGIAKVTKEYSKQSGAIKTNQAWYEKLNDVMYRVFNKKNGGLISSLNFGALIGKLYFVRNITKRLGQSISNILQRGIDFTETLNLWQTAMRGNVGEARNFIAEMNKAYGISESTLMNYQAIYKNILSTLGDISETVSYDLSESLTQMTLDWASLFNVSIDQAMSKFQAMVTGQIRPVRSIGGQDVSENSIFALYKQMGGTKTMRQLTQTEKRLLRIYAMFTQMQDSAIVTDEQGKLVGDLSKTLTTNANILRSMKEQAIELATWLGNGLAYLIQESGVLVTINSYLFTAKELAKSLAYELGYREQNFINGITDSAEEANAEIDELQGKLLGFDKFRSLKDTNEGETDVEAIIAKALKSYQSLYKDVLNPAQTKSVELLKQMGYELKAYAQIGEQTFEGTPEEYAKWLETISEEQRKNVSMVEVWKKNGESLKDTIIDTAKGIGGILALFVTLKKPIVTILASFEYLLFQSKDFRESVSNIATKAGESIIKVGNSLFKVIEKSLPIIEKIVDFVAKLIDNLDKFELLEPMLWGIIGSLIAIKGLQLGIFVFTNAKLILIVGAIGALITVIAEVIAYWQDFGDIANFVFDKIKIGFMKLVNSLGNIFISFYNKLIKSINAILTPISDISEKLGGRAISIPLIPEMNWGGVGTFAKGGLLARGNFGIVGEAGAELVYNSNANTGVTNVAQFKQAMLEALFTYGTTMASNETEQTQNININVGSQNWFNITRKVAQQNGYDLVKMR